MNESHPARSGPETLMAALVLVLMLGFVHPASAAIARTNQSFGNCSICTSITLPHTVSAGSERLLMIDVPWYSFNSPSGDPVTAVTYGGVAATKAGSINGSCNGSYCGVSKWRLLNPAAGTANIAVSTCRARAYFATTSCTGPGRRIV